MREPTSQKKLWKRSINSQNCLKKSRCRDKPGTPAARRDAQAGFFLRATGPRQLGPDGHAQYQAAKPANTK